MDTAHLDITFFKYVYSPIFPHPTFTSATYFSFISDELPEVLLSVPEVESMVTELIAAIKTSPGWGGASGEEVISGNHAYGPVDNTIDLGRLVICITKV